MEVQLASSSERQIWVTKFLSEYVRESGFMPYMGKAETNIFQFRTELLEEAGKTINVPVIASLKGSGVSGSQVLDGNEEDLMNFNDQITVDWLRNGVRVPKSTQYLTEINLMDAAKSALRSWDAEKLRDGIIQALGSIIIAAANSGSADSWVTYAAATAAQKNAYLTLNADRILFGSARANASSNVWATALGNVDSTNDLMSTGVGSLAKRMARTTGPANTSFPNNLRIRPFKTNDGKEYFVMFCASNSFRDLKKDTVISAANRDARGREGNAMDKNPIFQDGDQIYDGVIYREIPELDQLKILGAGNAGIDVDQNFLCGTQTVGIGWGQQPKPVTDYIKDYGFRPGVGIEELRGQKKLSYSGVQYGCVTCLTSSTADT
jgi:hypothetical protein